jgi:hypothetical protein
MPRRELLQVTSPRPGPATKRASTAHRSRSAVDSLKGMQAVIFTEHGGPEVAEPAERPRHL